jgi:hypothetical protein
VKDDAEDEEEEKLSGVLDRDGELRSSSNGFSGKRRGNLISAFLRGQDLKWNRLRGGCALPSSYHSYLPPTVSTLLISYISRSNYGYGCAIFENAR